MIIGAKTERKNKLDRQFPGRAVVVIYSVCHYNNRVQQGRLSVLAMEFLHLQQKFAEIIFSIKYDQHKNPRLMIAEVTDHEIKGTAVSQGRTFKLALNILMKGIKEGAYLIGQEHYDPVQNLSWYELNPIE